MDRIFLHYLDVHTGIGASIFNLPEYKLRRLKYDILAFVGHTFLLAAPAVAKSFGTMLISNASTEFLSDGKFQFVLQEEYGENFSTYVDQRIDRLASVMSGADLAASSEYRGYTSGGWRTVFGERKRDRSKIVFAKRRQSADFLFRNYVRNSFVDPLVRDDLLGIERVPEVAIDAVLARTVNPDVLFQREAVFASLLQSTGLPASRLGGIRARMDREFDRANAEAAGARLPTDVFGLNGVRLEAISRNLPLSDGCCLKNFIDRAPLKTIIDLANNEIWIRFVLHLDQAIRWLHQTTMLDNEAIAKLVSLYPGANRAIVGASGILTALFVGLSAGYVASWVLDNTFLQNFAASVLGYFLISPNDIEALLASVFEYENIRRNLLPRFEVQIASDIAQTAKLFAASDLSHVMV